MRFRTAAEHDDLLAVGRLGLALFLVRGIHVRGVGGEFGGAGVHALVDRTHVELVAQLAHFGSDESSRNARRRSEKPRRFSSHRVA